MEWSKWVLLTALVTLIRHWDALSLLVTYKMHSYMQAVNVKLSR